MDNGRAARAASMALSAIWAGVTGTLSDLPVVSPDPVTAQVMNTSRFIASVMMSPSRRPTHGVDHIQPVASQASGEASHFPKNTGFATSLDRLWPGREHNREIRQNRNRN